MLVTQFLLRVEESGDKLLPWSSSLAWFCRRFARVEAAREAKNQIEQKFGQTQAAEHHIQSFNDWLEKLPDDLAASLAATTHIEHFLASLSPLVPSDLEDSYDPPRKTLTDEHAAAEQGAGFASLTATQDRLLVIERPVARAARNLDLDQHWIDYAGRKLSRSDTTKAGRKKLMGAVEMGDTPLTESSSRALMAGYADSAASKVRLELGARIDAVESSVGALSTQLQSVDLKMDSMKDELLQAVRKGSKGGKGAGKGKPWQQRQQQQRWSQQPQQQQQAWSQQQQPQQQPQAPHSGWQSTVPAPAAGQSWASGRKPLACWGCGGPHMERNCPNKGTVDATRADTRHGAHVCSLALSGDDSGEATLEEVEEKFGGLEEVRGFVNAVRAQSEAIMTAAVQQGSHTARPAHPAWSLLSARLTDTLPTDTPTHTVPTQPEWNRLYVAKSLHLRPCHLLYEQHGTARLMFACDYRDSNSLGQLKDSDRLYAYVPALSHCLMTDLTDAQQLQLQLGCTEQTAPTALTAQGTEQRHLYEPLMGASRECQVVPGTTPTALLAGAGTTKVSAHPAHTALASLNACDRKSVSSTPNPVSKVNSLSRLRDSTGKLLLASKSRDDSAAVESESHTHPAVRNTVLSYPDVDLNTSACVAVDPVDPIDSGLTRSLCDLIGVVHRDINCSSSSRSDCIRSAEADLHDPECSSTSAGTVVNAPLNASSALSDTNLAQTHSARHDAQSPHSVPNSHSQLQGEYPPCLSSDVLCGDLSPRVSHSCDPLFSESWGKILGLVAAPLVGNAVSSPVAESADPSGKDSLVRMGPACHSIASQSGNQPDSQSEAHTAPSSAVGLCEPLDRQKSKRIWRSKFGSDPSCVAARAPSHTAHPRQLRWGCIDRRIIYWSTVSAVCTPRGTCPSAEPVCQCTPTPSFSISISVKPVPIFNWRAP